MEIPGYITVNETAEKVNLSNKRVYQLIIEDKLEAVRLGREYLVKVKSVDKYLKGRNGKTSSRKGKR